MLSGNIFSCENNDLKSAKNDQPQDRNKETAICGSGSLDLAMLISSVFFLLAISVFMYCYSVVRNYVHNKSSILDFTQFYHWLYIDQIIRSQHSVLMPSQSNGIESAYARRSSVFLNESIVCNPVIGLELNHLRLSEILSSRNSNILKIETETRQSTHATEIISAPGILEKSIEQVSRKSQSIPKSSFSDWFDRYTIIQVDENCVAFDYEFQSLQSSVDISQLRLFVRSLYLTGNFSVQLLVIMVAMCFPLFAFIKQFSHHGYNFSNRSDPGSWYFTSVFMSGVIPAICYAVVAIVSVVCLLFFVLRNYVHLKKGIITSLGVGGLHTNLSPRIFTCRSFLLISAVVLLNCVIVIAVNTLYVFRYIQNHDTLVANIALQGALATFRLLWAAVAVPTFCKMLSKLTTISTNSMIWILLFLLIFNSLVAPGLAFMFTDSSCLRFYLFLPDAINTNYRIDYCLFYGPTQAALICLQKNMFSISSFFVPNFIYNYDCSSNFYSNYVPVLFYTHALQLFFTPAYYFFISRLDANLINKFGFAIPWILKPYDLPSKPSMMFRPELVISNLMVEFLMLLTFGFSCPMLAVLISFTIWMKTFFWRMIIARFIGRSCISSATHKDLFACHIQGMEKECYNVWRILRHSVIVVIEVTLIVFSFCIYDMTGDEMSKYNKMSALLSSIIFFVFTNLVIYMTKSIMGRYYTVRPVNLIRQISLNDLRGNTAHSLDNLMSEI